MRLFIECFLFLVISLSQPADSSIVYAKLQYQDDIISYIGKDTLIRDTMNMIRDGYLTALAHKWKIELFSVNVTWNMTLLDFQDHPVMDLVLFFDIDASHTTRPDSVDQLLELPTVRHQVTNLEVEALTPVDCSQLQNISTNATSSQFVDGKYTIVIGDQAKTVYCEFSDEIWTRIHRHYNGTASFEQTDAAYANGFGDVLDDHWLGLDNLAYITSKGSYQLHVTLEDCSGSSSYIIYENFVVGAKSQNYKLILTLPKDAEHARNPPGDSIYNPMYFISGKQDSTPVGDQFSQLGNIFSTQKNNGGWWFNDNNSKFNLANLNGPIESNCASVWPNGLIWNTWHGASVSIKGAGMKIRVSDEGS